MKKIALLLLSLSMLFSCSEKNPNSTISKDSLRIDSLGTKALTKEDTLMLGGYILWLSPIDESVYNKYSSVSPKEKEIDLLSQDSSQVKRIKDSLIFTSINKKEISLTNNLNEEEDYEKYSYIQNLSDIKQWLISGVYNEYYDYILIDQNSGEKIAMPGLPIVSPNKKLIISGNSDLVAAFTFNGLELYKYENKKLTKVATKELANWGANEIKWIDDSTLLIKQDFIDSSSNRFQKFVQAKIR